MADDQATNPNPTEQPKPGRWDGHTRRLRARRAARQAKGLCIDCGGQRAAEGIRCERCRDKQRERSRKHAAKRQADPGCNRCGEPVDAPEGVFCIVCRDDRRRRGRKRRPKASATSVAAARRRRARRDASGLCLTCGGPRDSPPRRCCKACKQEYDSRNRARAEQCQQAGVCRLCKGPLREGRACATCTARSRTRYAREREAILAKGRQRRNTPKGKAKTALTNAKRRARVLAAGSDLTAAQWQEILEAQGGLCALCDKPFSEQLPPTRDHIVPVSLGGALTKSNAQALCRSCNSRKRDRVGMSPFRY